MLKDYAVPLICYPCISYTIASQYRAAVKIYLLPLLPSCLRALLPNAIWQEMDADFGLSAAYHFAARDFRTGSLVP